jgi:hypothetical protein
VQGILTNQPAAVALLKIEEAILAVEIVKRQIERRITMKDLTEDQLVLRLLVIKAEAEGLAQGEPQAELPKEVVVAADALRATAEPLEAVLKALGVLLVVDLKESEAELVEDLKVFVVALVASVEDQRAFAERASAEKVSVAKASAVRASEVEKVGEAEKAGEEIAAGEVVHPHTAAVGEVQQVGIGDMAAVGVRNKAFRDVLY